MGGRLSAEREEETPNPGRAQPLDRRAQRARSKEAKNFFSSPQGGRVLQSSVQAIRVAEGRRGIWSKRTSCRRDVLKERRSVLNSGNRRGSFHGRRDSLTLEKGSYHQGLLSHNQSKERSPCASFSPGGVFRGGGKVLPDNQSKSSIAIEGGKEGGGASLRRTPLGLSTHKQERRKEMRKRRSSLSIGKKDNFKKGKWKGFVGAGKKREAVQVPANQKKKVLCILQKKISVNRAEKGERKCVFS